MTSLQALSPFVARQRISRAPGRLFRYRWRHRLFSSPISDGLGITLEVFEVPMDFIHKQLFGQWVAWLLTAGHVLAALYLHYILRAPHLTGS